jgi:hypothetical protein
MDLKHLESFRMPRRQRSPGEARPRAVKVYLKFSSPEARRVGGREIQGFCWTSGFVRKGKRLSGKDAP